jgi:hypothetical protein
MNISPLLFVGQEPQFEKYSHGEIDQFSLIYNYHSIMQYGNKAFSSNNEDTMQSISTGRMVLGGEQMTNEDIMELNLLYDCKCKRLTTTCRFIEYEKITCTC